MPEPAYPRLHEPTPDAVRDVVRQEFDKESDTALTEAALEALISKFPFNTDTNEILLKVTAINLLYSARLNTKDLPGIARRIANRKIDFRLSSNSPDLKLVGELVAEIQDVTGEENYSFVTKYCSWHRQEFYPIHDGNVDVCLWVYKLQTNFLNFRRYQLRSYPDFYNILKQFRERFGLQEIGTKELDKFLWVTGDKILKSRRQHSEHDA